VAADGGHLWVIRASAASPMATARSNCSLAPARSSSSRSTRPRLLHRMAMSGWSGARVASPIANARSSWARAPARSPRACSTRPRLLCRVATVGWSGAKGRLTDRQRPLILFSCPFQTRQAVGMDAPKPTAGHPLGHPPGQLSKMDTLLGLLDSASGHQGGRPRRPSARCPPWAAVRPGIRAMSSRPGRERPSRPPVWLGGWRPSRASLLGQPFPTGSRCGPAREQGKQHEPTNGPDHAAVSPCGARRPGHRRALVMQPSTARCSRSRRCRRS
jgi:hypothetical protein